jgi:hypothetical protein
MSKFGSDFRVIGEAGITGLRYGAKGDFWSALAHTDIIGRLGRLIEHYGALEGNLGEPVVWDRVGLLSWLNTACENCLTCYPYGACGPEPQESHMRFGWALLNRIQDMNISWKEFLLYFGPYLNGWVRCWKGYPDKYNFGLNGGRLFAQDMCIAPLRFVEILDDLVQNRIRLSELPPANKATEPNLWI